MRHRIGNIGSYTGLGNPTPEILDNSGEISLTIKEMLNEAINLYFQYWEGCDYQINKDEIKFGIEPAYMYEDLKIICIKKEKKCSYIKTGRAFGLYGSGIRSTTKFYEDYKYNCKFKKFIDKWYKELF